MTQGNLVQDSFVKQINLLSLAKGQPEHDYLALMGTANSTCCSKRTCRSTPRQARAPGTFERTCALAVYSCLPARAHDVAAY